MISGQNGVGASVAIFGMLGAYLGYTLMNWNALDNLYGPTAKYYNLFFMIFVIILNISVGFSNPIIDNYGHLGGLIYGFFLIWVITKPYQQDDGMCCKYSIWFWISVVMLVFLYVGLLLIFFLVKKL